jgi:hypothetical protein
MNIITFCTELLAVTACFIVIPVLLVFYAVAFGVAP